MGNGQTIDGAELIDNTFRYTTTDKWNDLAIVVAWAVAFHLLHYALLVFNNRNYGESLTGKTAVEKQGYASKGDVATAMPRSAVAQHSVVHVSDYMPAQGSRQHPKGSLLRVAQPASLGGDESLPAIRYIENNGVRTSEV